MVFLWLTASNVFATEDKIYGLDGPPPFSFLDGSAYLIKDTDLKSCTSSECNTTMTLKAGCKVPYYQSSDFADYGDWIRIKAYICNNNYFEIIYADGFIPKNNIEHQVSLYVYDNGLKKANFIKKYNKNINSNKFLLKSCDNNICNIIADTRKDDIKKNFSDKDCFIEVNYTNYWENHGGWHPIYMSSCRLLSTNQILRGFVKFLK